MHEHSSEYDKSAESFRIGSGASDSASGVRLSFPFDTSTDAGRLVAMNVPGLVVQEATEHRIALADDQPLPLAPDVMTDARDHSPRQEELGEVLARHMSGRETAEMFSSLWDNLCAQTLDGLSSSDPEFDRRVDALPTQSFWTIAHVVGSRMIHVNEQYCTDCLSDLNFWIEATDHPPFHKVLEHGYFATLITDLSDLCNKINGPEQKTFSERLTQANQAAQMQSTPSIHLPVGDSHA